VLLLACVAMVGLYAILGTLHMLNNYTAVDVGQRLVTDLRSAVYAHLHQLSLDFYTRARVGDLLYRVTADTLALQSLTVSCLFPTAMAAILLVGMISVMLQLDATLTLLALAVCPALFVIIKRLDGRVTRAAGKFRESESEVFTVVQRAMSAMRLIQAFAREDDEHRRFMAASRQSLAAGLKLNTLQTFYGFVISMVIAVGTAAVVWVGARHVLDGTLSVGSLVVFVAYLSALYSPINSMFQTWGIAQTSTVGVRRVFDLLDVEREIADGTLDFPAGRARGQVIFDRVAFEYSGGHRVLNDISLRVEPGQTVAIVGATGAGKSTLLSLLPRFYDTTGGRILVDGVDVREYRLASLRRQIAMVLQPPLLLPTSVRDNIALGRPEASLDDIVAVARLARIHDTVLALPDGYDTVVGEQGVTLSEGEKQRITIARALLRDAPILILDEPTSAMDAETEALFLQGARALRGGPDDLRHRPSSLDGPEGRRHRGPARRPDRRARDLRIAPGASGRVRVALEDGGRRPGGARRRSAVAAPSIPSPGRPGSRAVRRPGSAADSPRTACSSRRRSSRRSRRRAATGWRSARRTGGGRPVAAPARRRRPRRRRCAPRRAPA
jgi:ATP-binding cassette subfamily B protein/subfamily B ATP-binding cassette protein MsbA